MPRATPDALRTLDFLAPAQSAANQPASISALSEARAQGPPAGRCCDPILLQPPPIGLRFTVLQKLPNGELAPVDPRQELDSAEEMVIRFEPNESGFLYVFERSGENWRRIATEQVRPPSSYIIPREGAFHNEGSGPREFLALFSRRAQTFAESTPAAPGPRGPLPAPAPQMFGRSAGLALASVQRPEQVWLSITLKYPK
jgi:hypothetical protein